MCHLSKKFNKSEVKRNFPLYYSLINHKNSLIYSNSSFQFVCSECFHSLQYIFIHLQWQTSIHCQTLTLYLNLWSTDTLKWCRTRVGYVSDTNTPRILWIPYTRSIGINYFNLKYIFYRILIRYSTNTHRYFTETYPKKMKCIKMGLCCENLRHESL